MITEATVKSFKLLFKVCSLLKLGFYKWKLPGDGVEVVRARHFLLGFFNYVILCGSCLNKIWFQIGYYLKYYEAVSADKECLNALFCIWYMFVAAATINNLLNIQQIMQCFCRMLAVHRSFCDRYSLEGKPKDTFSKVIRILVFVSIFQSVVFVVPFSVEPMSPNFIYRLVFSGGKYSGSYWFYHFVDYYITVSSWYPLFLQCFIVTFHALSSTYWLQQMRYGENQLIMNDRKAVTKMYRTLQFLMAEMNDCFSPLFWPTFMTANVFLHTYKAFAALKLHGTLLLAMYSTLTSYAISWVCIELVLYRLLGNMHCLSQTLIKSWADTASYKNRKLLQSFRPLGIRVGSIYIIRKTTALTIIIIVSNLVVHAVLLHR